MKVIPSVLLLLFQGVFINAQSPLGTWVTIDDKRNVEIALVEVFENQDQLFGRVLELLPAALTRTCERCPGDLKGKPLEGVVLIRNLKSKNGHWTGGKFLDPKSGREFDCSLWMEDDNTLKIRASIGFSFLGRTQTWNRNTKKVSK